MRRLLITVREVSGDDSTASEHAWLELMDAVVSAGGRAWRFRNSRRPGRYIEFIEWTDPCRPLQDQTVRNGRERLERIAPGSSEEWEEATTSTPPR